MSKQQRKTNLEYALAVIPDEMRNRLLTEVLTVDWNYTETCMLNYFANNDWENKDLEKIIKRIGIMKKITMKELPQYLSDRLEKKK